MFSPAADYLTIMKWQILNKSRTFINYRGSIEIQKSIFDFKEDKTNPETYFLFYKKIIYSGF